MPGILDFLNDPANQGLLSLSSGLLQAGGPSATPVSFGQALGQGSMAGIRGVQSAQSAAQQREMMGLQGKLLEQHGRLYGSEADKKDQDVQRQGLLSKILSYQPPTQLAGGLSRMSADAIGAPWADGGGKEIPASPGDIFKTRAVMLSNAGFIKEANEVADFAKKMNPSLEFKDGVWYDKDTGSPVRGGAGVNQQGFGYQTTLGPNGQISLGMLPGAADVYGAQQNIGAQAQAAHDLVTVPATGPNSPPTYRSRLSLLGGPTAAPPAAPGVAPAPMATPPVAPPGGVPAGMSPAAQASQSADAAQQMEISKNYGSIYNNLQNSSMANPGKIAKVKRIGDLLGDFEGGKLSGAGLEMSKAFNSLGIKIDPKLPNKEAAEAASNEVALELRSTADGGGMPGAMSNSDRVYLKDMTPQMAQTAEGRRLIIDAKVKVLERENTVADMARQYKKKYNKLDEGFFSQLSEWSERNPVFKK